MLSTGQDAAHEGLVCLDSCNWLMSPLMEEAHREHPAETARPGLPSPGSGRGLVAVTFGTPRVAPGYVGVLPVCWESVEPGDVLAVPLSGDITLSPAAAVVPGYWDRIRRPVIVPGTILMNRSCSPARADLVVIGRHGAPGSRSVIGGIQHALLSHARGPVVIVPDGC